MKVYRLKPGEVIDEGLRKVVNVANKRVAKSDDFFLLLVGLTGTGKSTIGLWLYTLFEPSPVIDFVALNREEFVEALQKVKNKPGKRFLDYDEAAVMSSEAMTKWNKAVVKLYMRIRSLAIFHVWCNPSPRIDRLLIEEKINGIIYVYTKRTPRKYIYISRKRVLRMLEDTNRDRVTLRLLQAHARKYGNYQGAFRAYQGHLKESYEAKKALASDTAIDEFAEEFGKNAKLGITPLAKRLGVNKGTLSNRITRWEREGHIIRGRDFEIDVLGHYKFYEKSVELIRERLLEESGRPFGFSPGNNTNSRGEKNRAFTEE